MLQRKRLFTKPSMHTKLQYWPSMLLIATLALQTGCVALNIPSERFQDANDHGGVLGHWRQHGHLASPIGADHQHGQPIHGHCSLDGGPLEVDPFGPDPESRGKPKEPEVPWPRFHPVPTRPVFGANEL